MDSPIYNQSGKEVGKIKLPESVFGLPWNDDLVHQVVTSMRTNEREPWAHTKDRGQVAGGGKKPWQQKGTGRARHGSIRSPLWVGGGVTHGPNAKKNFARKVNRKMMSKALFTVLSRKFKDGEILFIDKLSFDKPKTKDAKVVLENFSAIKGFAGITKKRNNAALFALGKKDQNTEKSLRNFSNIMLDELRNLNPVNVMDYKFLVIGETESAIKFLSAKKLGK